MQKEQKFIVIDPDWEKHIYTNVENEDLVQGYISMADPDAVMRVRIRNGNEADFSVKKGYKALGNQTSFEYKIPVEDAQKMLKDLCEQQILKKTRHTFNDEQGLKWEVDIYEGKHEGLIIAAVHLDERGKTAVIKPEWAGEDITKNSNYIMSNLAAANPDKSKAAQHIQTKGTVAAFTM